jgi:hypothetical protein
MKILKLHYKNIYLQIMPLNLFFVAKFFLNSCETMKSKCVFIQMIWNLVHVYLLWMCGLLKKFKNEFSFVSFEQSMRKKIDFKFWYIKQFDIMLIGFDVRLS